MDTIDQKLVPQPGLTSLEENSSRKTSGAARWFSETIQFVLGSTLRHYKNPAKSSFLLRHTNEMRSMTDSEITPVVTEPLTKKVSFPPSALLPEQNTEVKCQTSIVVVGANGSGKSRFGTWLEFKGPQKERVHRIAAQRSLVFPENSSPIGFEKARDSFYWAPSPPNWHREQYERGKPQLRLQHRYGGSMLRRVWTTQKFGGARA